MTSDIILSANSSPALKYNPNLCDTILDVASQGGHVAAMMVAIGIRSKSTWSEWQKKYPEFRDAVEYAKILSQAYYEGIGLKAVHGEIPNFSATTYALLMNNKFGDEFKRNHTGGGSTEITFNTVNMSSEQMNERIAQKIEKLKSLGVVLDASQENEESSWG